MILYSETFRAARDIVPCRMGEIEQLEGPCVERTSTTRLQLGSGIQAQKSQPGRALFLVGLGQRDAKELCK